MTSGWCGLRNQEAGGGGGGGVEKEEEEEEAPRSTADSTRARKRFPCHVMHWQ